MIFVLPTVVLCVALQAAFVAHKKFRTETVSHILTISKFMYLSSTFSKITPALSYLSATLFLVPESTH